MSTSTRWNHRHRDGGSAGEMVGAVGTGLVG